ncbi:MAG: S66 peptidase family protein [Gemmatimonadaceae bacterium]
MSSSTSSRWPPLLAPGARVALLSPAGPLCGEEQLARAADNARSFGWEPVPGEHALARRGYLAGDDALRAADLDRALRDPRVDGIWFTRGGYGMMRLLDGIDYGLLRDRPRAVLGYSDITAFHLALRARARIVSFHAPTARSDLTPFSRESMRSATVTGEEPCGIAPPPDARVLREGRARGPVVGGNLALIAALCGTPYALDLDGAILLIEDVGEPLYRIDRMLRQLRLSGGLSRVAALAIGAFSARGDDPDNCDDALEALLVETAAVVDGPVIAGIPLGHIPDQWTIPLGAIGELDSGRLSLTIERPPTP